MSLPTYDELKQLVGKEFTDSRSPAGNWLRPRIEQFEKGIAAISVIVRPEMCNVYKHIHGGMMSLLVDEAIGWAVVSLNTEQHYTSVSLNIDFLYAAAEGERIKAIAHIIRHGKKVINAAVEVLNAKNQLICRANSNLVATNMKVAFT